jgi:hypothetical protein
MRPKWKQNGKKMKKNEKKATQGENLGINQIERASAFFKIKKEFFYGFWDIPW